ncbi:MAG: L-threonylcarbamoyladenylate synthase [bacterium]
MKLNFWSSEKIIEKLKQSLQQNNINITSTDTIPGLLANITEKSFKKLNVIKKERENKPYLVLISSQQKIKDFVDPDALTPNIEFLIKNCWPGPVTIIFKAKQSLPDFLKSKENTIALRCPKHKNLLKLLESFGGLFSTSANISGQKSPTALNEIDPTIINQIDLFVLDEKDEKTLAKILPSTLIDASKAKEGIIKIVREGQYKIEELEKYYGTKFEK